MWTEKIMLRKNLKKQNRAAGFERIALKHIYSVQFSSVQLLSRVRLLATPWIAPGLPYKVDSQWEFDIWLGIQSHCSLATWRDRVGKEGGDTWMPMGDSCCGMGKTITVLKKKKKLKKKEILLELTMNYGAYLLIL